MAAIGRLTSATLISPWTVFDCVQALPCLLFSSNSGPSPAKLAPAPRKLTLPSMAITTAAFWYLRITSPFLAWTQSVPDRSLTVANVSDPRAF
ncbi:hypothetical protein STENM223S_04856 [Streptomyces tendae]